MDDIIQGFLRPYAKMKSKIALTNKKIEQERDSRLACSKQYEESTQKLHACKALTCDRHETIESLQREIKQLETNIKLVKSVRHDVLHAPAHRRAFSSPFSPSSPPSSYSGSYSGSSSSSSSAVCPVSFVSHHKEAPGISNFFG